MRSATSMLSSVLVTLVSLSLLSSVIAQNYSFADWQRYNSAWHMDYIDKLVDERLDPIVNPNGVSGHMHQIIGGSRFGASYDGNEYKNAGCTTCPIKADKSNYWMPKLFWINNGGSSFTPISGGQRFYYFLQQSSPAERVTPFPDGLRILVGNPDAKQANTFSFSFTCQINPPPYQGSIRADNFNFGRDCPHGMKVETHFPQCWDGVNLYKSDGSHMSYPVGTSYRVGNCPWTHPIRIPQIMLEFTYYTSTWAPGRALNGNLAWANGDTTSYGVHADFVNGWSGDVLARALNDSRCLTADEMAIEQCPVMAPEYDYQASRASNCKPEKGVALESPEMNDNVPIPRLPGCSPLWGQGPRPACPPGDFTPNIARKTGNDGSYIANPTRNFVPPTTPGWKEIACLRESYSMLKDQVEFYDQTISQTTCENTCHKNGFQYAAIGLTQGKYWKCLCGTGVQDQAQLWPQMCTQPCPGNSSQTCGGDFSGYSVYYAPEGTTQIGTNSSYFGCYQNPSPVSAGLEGKASYSFSTNTMMTQEMCFQACADRGLGWAAIRSGQNCFCGADKDFNLGTGRYVSDATCNMNCTGNKDQVCGFWTGSSVFNVTALGYAKKDSGMPAGHMGCYNLPSGKGVANAYTYWDNALVPERCTLGCLELGYNYAEVDTGRICNCGDTLTLGASQPPSFCQTACFGNSSQTCGGSWNGDVYTTNSSLPRLDALKATKKAGWIGCFDNSKAGGFKDWSRSNAQAQTVERCQISCQELGYKWAGLQNGDTCKCSNTAPAEQIRQSPTSLSCQAPCRGNSSETCGGTGGFIEAYDMSRYQANVTVNALPGYVGCYQQNSGPGLKQAVYYDNAMTIQMCQSICKETKQSMAGLSGTQCSCGDTWEGGNVLASLSCNTPCPGNLTQVCGQSFIASVYNSSVGVVPTMPTAGYVGCYTDNNNRTLAAYSYTSRDGMTPASCKATCAGRGFKLAGVQNGWECYCDNALGGIGRQVPSKECSVACNGNNAMTCGGSWRLSVYETGTTGNTTTPAQPGRSLGCYQDFNTLSGSNYYSDYMSANLCLPWCKEKGFAFGGMSGRQCRCGNESPAIVLARTTCNAPCTGNSTQTCGSTSGAGDVWSTSTVFAANANPYTTPDSKGYMGCWTDGASRLLTGTVFYSNTLTPATCAASCAGSKYTFAGVQNGNECRCGNTLDPKTTYYRTSEGECGKPCTGDSKTMCGGNYRYNVYATKEFIAGGGNSTSPTAPAAKQEGELGCYGRGTFASSTAVQTLSGGMTTGFCRRYCRVKGFSTAGLMGGNTCFCGTQNTLAAAVPDSGCATACAGNSTSMCGGDITLSVYNTVGQGALTVPGYPADYIGCYVDGTPRLLTGFSTRTNTATPAQCKTVCDAQGFPTYGLQNGNECYCGNLASTDLVTDNQCSSNCAGNANQKCGGWYRMSVFGKLVTNSTTTTSAAAASSSSSSSRAVSSSASSSTSSSASRSSSSSSAAAISTSSSRASTAAPSSSASVSRSSSASATTVSPSASSESSSTSASNNVTDSSIPTTSVTSSSMSEMATLEPVPSSSVSESTSDSTSITITSSSSASSDSAPSSVVTSVLAPLPSSSAEVSSISASSSSVPASESTSASVPASSDSSPSSSSTEAPSPSSSQASSSSSAAESSASVPVSSSSVEPISSVSASATTSTSSAAAPSPTPTDPSHVGCFASTTVFANANMTCDATTPRMCKIWCNAMNFQYAAVHDGDYCGCSNEIAGLNEVDLTQCNTPCIADVSKTCGGQSTFEVFEAAPLARARRDLGLNARGRTKAWARQSSE